jgi:LCP family protein required for cell wall assembly
VVGELSVVERAVEDDGPEQPGRSRGDARMSRRAQAWLIVLCSVGVVVAGTVGVLGLIQHRISSELSYIDDPFAAVSDRPTSAEPAAGTPAGAAAPMTILVLGSDSRISAGDESDWAYGAQRTDAIMLVHISGDRQSVQVMSIPRDSWVPIPGYGDAKINAAFSFGGPSLMIETVEQLTGVRIDHFAIADFESFAALTDDLGGVEITLPNGMDSRGVTLDPGTYTLTGEQALAYVRERYALTRGDFDRVQRQQNWMRAILRESFDDGALTNPFLLTSLLGTAAGAMTVDDGFTMDEMTSLALSLRDIRPSDLTFLTVPTSGTGWSDDGQSIVNLDRTAFDALMVAVSDDAAADYIEDHTELETLGGPGSVS